MKRLCSYPADHWRMRIDIPFSMGVRQGDLFALCGQADLKGEGIVQNPGNLETQTIACIGHILRIVDDLGCEPGDLSRLVVYYLDDASIDRQRYETLIANTLGTSQLPVMTLVPLDSFFYPGLMVEIDAYGVAGAASSNSFRIPGSNSPFSKAIRCGQFTFVGGIQAIGHDNVVQYPGDIAGQSRVVLEKLDDLLDSLKAGREDIVKINNWYAGSGAAKDWETSARIRAAYYPEPGPVATGIPVSVLNPGEALIQTDCWIMQTESGETMDKQHYWPEGHWDWPIHLPFKHGLRCGDMVYVGGQVSMDSKANVLDPNDVSRQTRTSMENLRIVLDGFSAGLDDILKLNTFYLGREEETGLHDNLSIRSGYFNGPGTASTGIPFKTLAYSGMEIEIEAIAMLGSKKHCENTMVYTS